MVSAREVSCCRSRSAITRQKEGQREWLNARCVREALVGRGVRPTLCRVFEVKTGMVSVAVRDVEIRTGREVGKVMHR
jgi:hypothetical protein